MNGETKLLYDTSALIEFFLGSAIGETVKDSFMDEDTENLIPTIVILELISKLKRINHDPTFFVKVLEENATIINLTLEIAKKAGELHAKLKNMDKEISVPDCIIMMHGQEEDAIIITRDQHFSFYEKARLLE